MFERFSRDARQVVVRARDESRRLGHGRIGTVHLLLALVENTDSTAGQALREHGVRPDDLRERVLRLVGTGPETDRVDPLDGDALAAIGIDLDEVRRTVEAGFGDGALDLGSGSGQGWNRHSGITAQARKTLELSLRSAIALKQRRIRSGHLLLGLLRATGKDNLALQVLADADVDVDALSATATRFVQADAA
ncbi:MAG: Clp protease N-terminal domain-containing protein [Actinomadura sp.]